MLSIIAKHGDVKSDIHRVYDEVTNIINDFNICHSTLQILWLQFNINKNSIKTKLIIS